jgi:hypothetical protein
MSAVGTFGDRLREAVRRSGRSAAWLAHETGINPATISRWMQGHTEPQALYAERVAAALGVEAGWLLRGELAEAQTSVAQEDSGPAPGVVALLSNEALCRSVGMTARERAALAGLRGADDLLQTEQQALTLLLAVVRAAGS